MSVFSALMGPDTDLTIQNIKFIFLHLTTHYLIQDNSQYNRCFQVKRQCDKWHY